MAYKVMMKTGQTVTIADAVRAETDGSGTRLYSEDGSMVSSFSDGSVSAVFPADSEVEQPAAPADVPEPDSEPKSESKKSSK